MAIELVEECPFCNHKGIHIKSIQEDAQKAFAALCPNCMAQGPLTSSHERAVKLWNVRKG